MFIFRPYSGAQDRAEAATESVRQARREARANDRVAIAERQAEKAIFLCEVLYTILKEKLGVRDEELLDRIRDVDMQDGILDGKVRRPPVDCPRCKRQTAARFHQCMYCGEELEGSPFAL